MTTSNQHTATAQVHHRLVKEGSQADSAAIQVSTTGRSRLTTHAHTTQATAGSPHPSSTPAPCQVSLHCAKHTGLPAPLPPSRYYSHTHDCRHKAVPTRVQSQPRAQLHQQKSEKTRSARLPGRPTCTQRSTSPPGTAASTPKRHRHYQSHPHSCTHAANQPTPALTVKAG